jgi:predicted nucleic acid-binding protein
LLLDSNVLIDVLLGEEAALRWLESQSGELAISVITWMEILVGCQPQESPTVEQWLERFARLELSQSIAYKAVRCRRERGLKLPDAIILATARIHGCLLVTRNTRDFPETLEGVLMPYAI